MSNHLFLYECMLYLHSIFFELFVNLWSSISSFTFVINFTNLFIKFNYLLLELFWIFFLFLLSCYFLSLRILCSIFYFYYVMLLLHILFFHLTIQTCCEYQIDPKKLYYPYFLQFITISKSVNPAHNKEHLHELQRCQLMAYLNTS